VARPARPRVAFLPVFLLLAAILSGCGAVTAPPKLHPLDIAREAERQRMLYLEDRRRTQVRLLTVARRIGRAARPYCGGDIGPFHGLLDVMLYDFPPEFRLTARRLYRADRHLRVLETLPGSPAEVAGLRAGDRLAAVDGEGLKLGRRARFQFRSRLDLALRRNGTAEIGFWRGGAYKTARIGRETVCAYPVVQLPTREINAFADGSRVYFTRGILDLLESDDELAWVMAHEFAHNAMRHPDKQRLNSALYAIPGLALDFVFQGIGLDTDWAFTRGLMTASLLRYSPEFEREADYLASYIVTDAGYTARGGLTFFRRIGMEAPRSITRQVTHPVTPERALGVEAAMAEIALKRRLGQRLRADWRGVYKAVPAPRADPFDRDDPFNPSAVDPDLRPRMTDRRAEVRKRMMEEARQRAAERLRTEREAEDRSEERAGRRVPSRRYPRDILD
jgi:hypothetical protein